MISTRSFRAVIGTCSLGVLGSREVLPSARVGRIRYIRMQRIQVRNRSSDVPVRSLPGCVPNSDVSLACSSSVFISKARVLSRRQHGVVLAHEWYFMIEWLYHSPSPSCPQTSPYCFAATEVGRSDSNRMECRGASTQHICFRSIPLRARGWY